MRMQENAAASGEEAAAAGGGDPPPNEAPNSEQKERFSSSRHSGSYSFDDADRPLWDRETKLEREYHYDRADGSYAYTVLKGRRKDGEKTFLRGRRVQGTNDWQAAQQDKELYRFPGLETYRKGTGEEPEVLFRLPELLAAMAERPDETVFLCEGEKDVETLLALGLIATTNANGALKWEQEFSVTLAGRDVAVMKDNDDNGRKRGRVVPAALRPHARSVVTVELPGLPEHGDVTDWLEAGHTKEELLAEVGRARESGGGSGSEDFARDDNGRPYRSPENARLALALLGVTVRYDEFAGRYELSGLSGFGSLLDDAALTRMRLRIEEELNLPFAKERWADIVTDQARRNSYHPVREYLNARQWDGVERLDRWLPTYAGAEDSEYVRAIGAIILIAAVRRVREPGCKFDEMLVLESPQGTNKSTALSVLAVREDWFADDLPLDSDSKVLMERIAGRWLVELAELKGMRRGAVEHVKSMLSRRVDKARLAYGRMTTEQPRQCVFFGTTNDSQYLRDMTGNRRFWPVRVSGFDLAALRRDRDQLWAEAAMREASGASIRLPERLWAVAGLHQSSREIGDPYYEILSERLDGQEGKVRASDIWEIVGLGEENRSRRTQDDNVRISAVMHKLGWHRPKSKVRFNGRPQLAWVKGDRGSKVDAYAELPRDRLFPADERPF